LKKFIDKSRGKQVLIGLGIALAFVFILVFSINYFLKVYTHNGEKIPVPVLYGLDLAEAAILLDELGLRYEVRDSIFEAGKVKNAVLSQDPDTGEFVKEGRIIYLGVNSSQVPRVKMPNLDHKNINQGIMILESLGLFIGKIDTTNDIAESAILEQKYQGKRILPDTEIPKGSVIDLVIGDGKIGSVVYEGEVDVPDLVGASVIEATIILEAYGLKLGTIASRGTISDSSRATIVSQIPSYAPEAKVPVGSRVSVLIKQ
jgi:beta-lactam-binding protein with PASTA domain